MLPAIVKPFAEADLKGLIQWYDDQIQGLGLRFIQSVQLTFESIQSNPKKFQVRHRKIIRAAPIKSFPFLIYCTIEENRIVVLAVFHMKRNPSVWKSRLHK